MVDFGLQVRNGIYNYLYSCLHLHLWSTSFLYYNSQVSTEVNCLASATYHRPRESEEVFDQLIGCQSFVLGITYLFYVILDYQQNSQFIHLNFLTIISLAIAHPQDFKWVEARILDSHRFPLILSSLISGLVWRHQPGWERSKMGCIHRELYQIYLHTRSYKAMHYLARIDRQLVSCRWWEHLWDHVLIQKDP